MPRLILAMFTLSGAAGLVFECVLQRALSRAFGVSAFATSTVLAAYMGGLALGAVVFGRTADKAKNPLKLYAGLELGIGIFAATLPLLIPAIIELFSSVVRGSPLDSPAVIFGRLVIALAVTLLPTILMGGTLPAVAKALMQRELGAAVVARLYTLNVLGAALGALLAAYVFMPSFGLSGTAWVGATCNLLAAAIALRVRPGTGEAPAIQEAAVPAPARGSLLLAAAASGLLTFAIEVGWFQLLAVVVGNSVYAFGLMLAVFLLGLMLGSTWVGRQKESDLGFATLGKVQLYAAIALAVTIPLWDRVPDLFIIAGAAVTSFWGRELVRAIACVEVILVPAAFLGAVFPLVLRLAARDEKVGRAVGGIAAANTLGAVFGSIGTGFLLLPSVGARGVLVTVTLACAGLAALWLPGRRAGYALAVAALALALPNWNLARLGAGSNVYFADTGYSTGQVIWSRESVASGLTTVVKAPNGGQVLLTNGKFQGNDTGEVAAQRAFAQLPLLLTKDWGRALVIGIGTGCSVGVIGSAPFKEVHAVDLSRDIVDAARQFFVPVNGGLLDSGRVKVHVTDGRNLLLLDETQYDLVSIELSSIWFAGAADLYNKEFYELVKRRLSPRGVLQQWIQLHHMTRRDAAVILQSVRAVLPHLALFYRGRQGIILASREPIVIDYAVVTETSKAIAGQLSGAGLPGGDLLSITGDVLLDEEGVKQLIEEEAKKAGLPPEKMVSTDDNLWLEYSTPKANADDSLNDFAFVESVMELSTGPLPVINTENGAQRAHAMAAFAVGRGVYGKANEILQGQAKDEPRSEGLRHWVEAKNGSAPRSP
jgi:spermidine synthase